MLFSCSSSSKLLLFFSLFSTSKLDPFLCLHSFFLVTFNQEVPSFLTFVTCYLFFLPLFLSSPPVVMNAMPSFPSLNLMYLLKYQFSIQLEFCMHQLPVSDKEPFFQDVVSTCSSSLPYLCLSALYKNIIM